METFGQLRRSNGFNTSILAHLPGFGRSFNINQHSAIFSKQHGFLEQIPPIRDVVPSLPFGMSPAQIIILILCIAWALGPLVKKPPAVTNAVYHGYRSWIEPTFFVRARFIFNSKALIASGSLKVRPAATRTRLV